MTTVLRTVAETRTAVARARQEGLSIGLVPTMGALHAGHASLIQAARAETGFVAVSIFVNPSQFGPNEDFSRYPRPLERDLELCRQEGVAVAFVPDVETMYPPGARTYVEVEGLQDLLCGQSRPGHFRGVATVVLKLLHTVQPDRAYFGQKDYQQARLIKQMVTDLLVPVELRLCPIVRDKDGLALSSRNQYLTAEQRREATVLYRALRAAERLIKCGEKSPGAVEGALTQMIRGTPGAELDYAAVVDALSLEPVKVLKGKLLLAVAVRFGNTRLIDNVLVNA